MSKDDIRAAFDRNALKRICEQREETFENDYMFTRYAVDQPAPDDYFLFRSAEHEAGVPSKILAVAHLDTVGLPDQRKAQFLETEGGLVVYSRALDDRLGAYIILDLLPKLGLNFDILLTVGEESGRSTAQFFDNPEHEYNWMIEFDRGGTDVVMYQYEDSATAALVRETGARVEAGIFSDISYLDHLGVKGFNWGVGYQDYHGPRAHAWLDDTFKMVEYFLDFHENNAETKLVHDPSTTKDWWGSGYSDRTREEYWDDGECDMNMADGTCSGQVLDTLLGYLCEAHYEELEPAEDNQEENAR